MPRCTYFQHLYLLQGFLVQSTAIQIQVVMLQTSLTTQTQSSEFLGATRLAPRTDLLLYVLLSLLAKRHHES